MACCKHPLIVLVGSGVRGQGSGHPTAPIRSRWFFAAGFVAVFLLVSSCGVKAPPQPREFVVPAPVTDVAVMVLPEGGLRITFTLPSKSIDGHPIEAVGGYRIVREGPGGQDVREHKRFSVSEARQRVGQEMAFFDELPAQRGAYRYCVYAFDIYGIYTGKRQAAEFCWEGTLAGKGDG